MAMRPPSSVNPCCARSAISALTVARAASQGLTVCRSEDATSNGWPAISARAKSETRPAATPSEAPGILSVISPAPTAKETAETEAASASARASNRTRRRKGVAAWEPADGLPQAPRCGRRARAARPRAQHDGGLRRAAQRADCTRPRARGRRAARVRVRATHGVELAVESGVKPQEALVSARSWLGSQSFGEQGAGAR